MLSWIALSGPATPFTDEVVLQQGLSAPTAVRFAANGDVFVSEKSGRVLLFEGLADPEPETVADLRASVFDFWDRGLLGLAIHPDYPQTRSLFVLYTLDAPPGEKAPYWNDTCPNPPGATVDGCAATGRLSRLDLEAEDRGWKATEVVLIDDAWCQQFPSHSIGALEFGPDGALYVSAGEGASFNTADYGQLGGSMAPSPTPRNVCGDPPGSPGSVLVPPLAEGGSLRSQDLLTATDPVGYSGSILRLDPATGAALPDNPLFGGSDAGDDPIIAFGLRNPFRFAIDPRGELWIGDVGERRVEEINRIADPTDAVVENFGWPCFEGTARHAGFDALDLDLCEGLYAAQTATTPFYSYNHGAPPLGCGVGGNPASISGLAFYRGGDYPTRLFGALFFADFRQGCIWALPRGADQLPDPSRVEVILSQATAVDLTVGPGGDLFYVDLRNHAIHRISVAPTPPLFSDGFEKGNTSAWSSTLP